MMATQAPELMVTVKTRTNVSLVRIIALNTQIATTQLGLLHVHVTLASRI